MVGDPPDCGPADYAAALTYLHKIEAAIVQGGWKPFETNRLKKLRALWSRRAFKHDKRFNLVGTRAGRLPVAIEDKLKPRPRRLSAYATSPEDDARRTAKTPHDQRRNPERKWVDIDADLPSGRARGMAGTSEGEQDVFEPEPGEMTLPAQQSLARQYLIPGQDTKGHANRVYCRVMPAHYRALCAIERSKHFGFRTLGDEIRWCIDFGVRELTTRAKVPQAVSALTQVDIIREIMLEEQYYIEFPQMFELMTTIINRHVSAGSLTEAARVVSRVLAEIELMSEDHWRDKYRKELMSQFGQHVNGTQIPCADFGTTEGDGDGQ